MHAWQNRGLRRDHGNRESKHGYSALVSAVDANVGRVMRKLEQMKIRGETTVVFTADQGYNTGHHGVWGKGNGTWPFNMYEESIRVPMVAWAPGLIAPGTKVDAMVLNVDIAPTAANIAEYSRKPPRKNAMKTRRVSNGT